MTKAIALDLHSLDHIRDARKVLMSDVTVAIEIAKQIRDRIEAHAGDEDGLIVFQAAVYVTSSNGYGNENETLRCRGEK